MKITLNKKKELFPFTKENFNLGDYFLFSGRYYLIVSDWTKMKGASSPIVHVWDFNSNTLETFEHQDLKSYTKVKLTEMTFEEG